MAQSSEENQSDDSAFNEYGAVRKRVTISPKALKIIDRRAESIGLSRGEVVVGLACGLIGTSSRVDFSVEELELIKKVVLLQLVFLKDKLAGRGLFEDQQLQDKSLSTITKQVEVLHTTLEKVEKLITETEASFVEDL